MGTPPPAGFKGERPRVSSNILDAAHDILGSDPDVAAVYLFGSHAKGKASPGSDVDLGVLMAVGKKDF